MPSHGYSPDLGCGAHHFLPKYTLAQADPYFKNGLITSYKISNYAVAVGEP